MLLERRTLMGTLLAAVVGIVSLLSQMLAQPAMPATPDTVRAAASRCMSPVPAGGKTVFGVYIGATPTLADDRATEEARFGRLHVARIYDPGLPPDNAWERRRTQLSGMQIMTSFRMPPRQVLAGVYDAKLRRFFKSAPRKRAIYWNYYHEPEAPILAGEFTAKQYRRAFRHIARIAGSLCRKNLYPTLILTGWTSEPASGRDWHTYSPGSRFISVLAWDPYNQAVGSPRTYRKPAQIFGNAVRLSRAAGKPFAIAETGTARTPADSSGTGRAAWIRATGRYLRSAGALFVTYFQSTNRGDFELRDRPSIKAYRAFVSR